MRVALDIVVPSKADTRCYGAAAGGGNCED
jgi:hypothetical protein